MRTFQAGRVSTAVLGLLLCPLAAHALFVGHERNGHGWSHLFQAGRDGFNGTEMVHLVAHKGSLYGGIGYWMNPVHRALEIARLDSPTGQWVFDGYPNPWAGRPELLKSITWTTDASGNPLTSPENILIAGYYLKWGDEARLFIAARLDDTQEWREKMYYSQTPWRERYFSARAAVLHQDAVTGVDHLFFTTGIPGIIRGSYDAVTETHVSFDQSPESGAFPTRPLGLVVVNGRLYTAGGSFIRRRNDGPSPSWDIVFDMADHSSDTVDEAVGGIRGLSMIPGPAGGESLFFAWCPNGNSRGCMVRVDIDGDTYTHTEEACVPDLAQEPLGGDTFITYTIANYNFPLPITTPGGGLVHIIGYQILLYGKSSVDRHPTTSQVAWINGQPLAYYAGAGYLIRKSATDYEARVPGGPRFCPGEVSPAFVAVRSLAHSPFAGDDSVYMGGYDCNNYVSSNTAWILQGTIDAVYAQPVEYGNRQCTTVTRTTTTHTSTSTSTLTTTLACGLCYLKNYAPHWVERSDFGVQLSKGNVTNAGNTLDGDPETSGSAKELIFDLRHDHHITAIEVDFSDCDCSQADSVIVSQWSYSQEQWENVASPTLDTSQGMVSRTFTLNVVSRYFRVAATDTNPTWRVGVSEVRLFGTQNVWGGHPQALAHSNWAGNDNGADFTCSQAEDHANLPDPGYTCDRARRWWASLCCVPAPTPAPTTTTTETTTTMSTTTLTISTTTISTGTTTTSSVSTSTVTGEQATTTTTTPADLPPEEVVTGIFDVVVSLPDQFVLDESVKDFILAFMAFLVTLPVERININFLQGDRGRLLNVPDVQLPAPTGAVRVGYVITVPRDRTKPSVVLPLQAAGSDLEGTSQDFADLSRQYGVDQTYSMAVVRLEVEDDESPITTGAPAIVDVPVARGEEKTSASVGLVMGILCSLGFLVGTTALVCYVRKRRRRLALVVPEAWPTKQLSINGLLTPEAWGPAKQPSLKDLSSNQAVSPQMGEKLSEKLDEKEPQKAEDRLSERSISTPSTPPSVVAVAVFSPRTKPADKQRRDRVMTLE